MESKFGFRTNIFDFYSKSVHYTILKLYLMTVESSLLKRYILNFTQNFLKRLISLPRNNNSLHPVRVFFPKMKKLGADYDWIVFHLMELSINVCATTLTFPLMSVAWYPETLISTMVEKRLCSLSTTIKHGTLDMVLICLKWYKIWIYLPYTCIFISTHQNVANLLKLN